MPRRSASLVFSWVLIWRAFRSKALPANAKHGPRQAADSTDSVGGGHREQSLHIVFDGLCKGLRGSRAHRNQRVDRERLVRRLGKLSDATFE